MAGMTEDDKYFITADGKKIAKNGLSPSRRQSFANEIAQATAPQMTPAAPAAAPMLQTTAAPQTPSIWEQPAAFDLTNPAQFGQAAPQQQASTTNLLPYNEPKAVVDPYGVEQIPKNIVKSYAQQSKAITDMAKIEAKKNEDIAKANLDAQRTIDMVDYERSVIGERKANAVNTVMADMEATRQELASAKIDPDRFFGSSTGKRIAAGIAIAFGAIGQALTKSNTNTALDIINGAIDNDIKAQKENVGITKDRLSAQRQLLSDTYTKFGDLESQQLAQRITATEMAQRKVSDIAARYGTQEALAKAEMINGQLGVKLQDDLLKLASLKEKQAGAQTLPFNKDMAEAEDNLRKQRENSKEYQNAIARRDSVQTMQAAFAEPSAAGDISGIYAFMKGQDPGSTVREGEFATAQNAGGVDARAMSAYNKLLRGERLTEAQRYDFLGKMASISAKSEEALAKRDASLSKIISARGLNPENILINNPSPGQPGGKKAQELSSTFVPDGQETKQKPQTAQTSRVMPGR